MNTVIIHFLADGNEKHAGIIKKLEQGAVSEGNTVTVVSGLKEADTFRFTPYEYIAVVVPCQGIFGGKISPKIAEVLSSCGVVGGKKGAALVVKSGFSPEKTCRTLMRAMEKEGMMIDYFEVIRSPDHALYAGKKLC